MPWTTSTNELRTLISDGPVDKLRYRKRVFGLINGVNDTFKTFEFRRVTNFITDPNTRLGVFKNSIKIAPVNISSDDPQEGEFTLAMVSIPVDGDVLEASYYVQWFLDTELQSFMSHATAWIGLGTDPSILPSGLQPAALHYGAQEAFSKLSVRWAEKMSEVYLLEDAPAADKSTVESYLKMSEFYQKKAEILRKQFYTRQDQNEAPLFSSIQGAVREPVPRR